MNRRVNPICRPAWWRLAAYVAALLPLLFVVTSLLLDPDSYRGEPPDWEPVLSRAETSSQKKDFYEARHLYLQAARLASWRTDWKGLLATACGMKGLDGATGSYFNTRPILVQAMMAAERKQSRAGLAVVAKAFAAIGEDNAAALARSRIEAARHEDSERVEETAFTDCWQAEPGDDRLEAAPKPYTEAG